MRILHTSDWHIGRSFHGHATLDALRGVLEALVAQVREHRVDLVIVAGDVFDSATPAAGAYTLLSETLRGLADAGATVVVTSGNHDSAARLGFQSALLRDGVHVVTDPATIGTPITVEDEHGPVHVYGIPYLEPVLLRSAWPGVRTQADVLARAMELIRTDAAARGGRSIAVAHCFAAGVEPTPHLERDIQQGGLDVVPLSTFDGVDYVALGHIHGRQRLSPRVRYAGAPLHYSFDEGHKPRGSWLVELGADGLVAETQRPRTPSGARWKPCGRLCGAHGGVAPVAGAPEARDAHGDARRAARRRALRRPRRRLGACRIHRPPAAAGSDAPAAGALPALRRSPPRADGTAPR